MFNHHFYIKPVRQIEIPQTLSETNTAMTEFASGCPKEENGRLRGEAREHDTKNFKGNKAIPMHIDYTNTN